MEEKFQNALEYLLGASDQLKKLTETLEDMYKIYHGTDKKSKEKVKIEINVKKPCLDENIKLDDDELEQLKKDLEEIMNDFTRK